MLLHVTYYAHMSSAFSSQGSTQFRDKVAPTNVLAKVKVWLEWSGLIFQVSAQASTSGVLFCKTGNAREKLHTAEKL